MFDFERSLSLAKEIDIGKKACYRNALLAFFSNKEFRKGLYVEGFANVEVHNFPLNVEHGWIELADGTILDPTFASLGHTTVDFFPGIKYTYSQASKLVSELESVPLAIHYGFHRHKQYAQAYKASIKAAYDIIVPPIQ